MKHLNCFILILSLPARWQVDTTVTWQVKAAEKLKAVKNAPSCSRDVVTDSTVAAESFLTAPQKVARTGDAGLGRLCLNIYAPWGRGRSWINFWLWIFNSDRPQLGFSSLLGLKPKVVTFWPGEFALGVNRSSHCSQSQGQTTNTVLGHS